MRYEIKKTVINEAHDLRQYSVRSRDSGPVERSATIRHEFSQLRIVFRFAGGRSHSRWPVVKSLCSSTLVCSRIVINKRTGSEDKLCPAPWQALHHGVIHLGVPILRYLFVTPWLIDHRSCICSKEISYLHEAIVIRFNCVSLIPRCPITPIPSPKMQAPISTCVSIVTPIVGHAEPLSSSSRHSYNHNIRSRQTLHHGVRPRHRSSWLMLVSVTIWSAPFLLH
jgi:hypothetical protein